MQNNPALLKALYQYDRHHSGRTAYDNGNLSEQLASLSSAVAPGASDISEAFQDSPLYTPEEETDQRTYTPTFQNNASGNVLFALPGIN